MDRLEEAEVEGRLEGMAGWRRAGDEIRKSYTFKDFTGAIEFVRRVGERAEVVQHHPDIDIRYTRVDVGLSTHDAGGLTEKDFSLARDVDALAAGLTRGPAAGGSPGNPLT